MVRPRAVILLVGNELVRGDVADVNGPEAARYFGRAGIKVASMHTAGDRVEDIALLLRQEGERAEIVLVAGGLGPTEDDLTRVAAARAFRRELRHSPEAWEQIRGWFARKGWSLVPGNERQALFPEGAEVVENRSGTAPGFIYRDGECRYYFLPGVPREFRAVFSEEIMPRIRREFDLPPPSEFLTLKSFGLSEAKVGTILSEIAAVEPGTIIGTRFSFPEIWIDLEARSREEINRASDQIREQMGKYIFGTGEETLESVTGDFLREKGLTLATAESCTGGLISHRITQIPGSTEYFERGVVSYSNKSKTELLGVDPRVLEAHGAVSEPAARAMAEGIRSRSGADLGLGVTGIAGPTGATAEKPVGLVCFGLASGDGTWTREEKLFGDRGQIKLFASEVALDWVRRYLLDLPR